MNRESAFDEMKRYVRFTDADSARLRAFGVVARPHFATIAEEFYDRTREHAAAHAVFTGEAQIMRLRGSLERWMERLCDGPHDHEYFLEREKIGRVHVRIGLPQRYMFTGMAVVRSAFERLTSQLPTEDASPTRDALARILDLELAIMIETYREDSVARIRRIDRLEHDDLRRRLARNEHRYINAVELAQLLVIGLDERARVWLFNREAERLTGLARDEILGKSFVDELLPEEQRDDEGARLERAVRGDLTAHGDWEAGLMTRAGRRRVVHWQLAYVPNTGDEEVVLFAIGQDVTDRNALLERTLRNEKLAAVGTLAAGLAHEIRNPLNGALLHVTYLERALKKLPEQSGEALGAVKIVGEEIRRLSALVKDFLVFARPSPANLKPTWVHQVCRRVADIVRSEAGASQTVIELDLARDDIEMRLDAEKMEQVLLNLLRNAVEALGSIGGGTVTLRTRRRPRELAIEVEDDGPGLPSPDAPIFDAFFSTKPSGTGLGLAIVQRIVSDHGGSVEVESKPGQTVFRVVLPVGGDAAGEQL